MQPAERVILAVDDDVLIRRLLKRWLLARGYSVHIAENGDEALRILEQHPEIQLVISDNDMPGMTGLELLEEIRRRFPKMFRIMLTGTGDLRVVMRAINENEIYRFVEKPWDDEVLSSAIHLAFESLLLQADLDRERARSEQLLLNVLPAPIGQRLKRGEAPIADSFPDVTILFSDIVGFTELSARLPAASVVEILNEIFSQFDALADKHGVEKIKTIGDAYLAVAGIPIPREDHAQAMAEMALDMLRVQHEFAKRHDLPLEMRIGVNSGPVVAGVIGKHKFTYDLWGDAVNVASRMESHGLAGRIQITEATYTKLGDRYVTEPRGSVDVKGKGPMASWWLLGRR
ncbi:MAG TPA: adenylate/guanylate cyclase domain-containing protein [Kofleriaceae bacterium]|jgi:class 3 adenylate cyclase